jgi:nitrogen regulatory protein P-II 1
MKKIEAIIRPGAVRAVLNALRTAGYPGVTTYEVHGHGKQKGITETYRGQTVEGLLPKIMVMLVVSDKHVAKIMKVIVAATRTGEIGDGKLFVSPVSECVRIRTGDKGEKALS